VLLRQAIGKLDKKQRQHYIAPGKNIAKPVKKKK
jgi:hypothetical protein